MSIQLKPLDQQVIVITGASSGIGLATAETAVQKGAKVVLAARSVETLDQVVNQLFQPRTGQLDHHVFGTAGIGGYKWEIDFRFL